MISYALIFFYFFIGILVGFGYAWNKKVTIITFMCLLVWCILAIIFGNPSNSDFDFTYYGWYLIVQFIGTEIGNKIYKGVFEK